MLQVRSQLSLLLTMSMLILCSVSTGCTVGVKEKITIVYTSYNRPPDEATGAIKIATNEPVAVTIEGDKTVNTKRDIGGMYVISGPDLEVMVKAVRQLYGKEADGGSAPERTP